MRVYGKALEDAEKYALSVSTEEHDRIRTADQMLTVVKARNRRMDFLSLDAQLIEMIPFSLWYGMIYKTVLTVSDGIAAQDVVVPTLFSAQNAFFIGADVEKDRYRNSVISYFNDRGTVTEPHFITLPSTNLKSMLECLESLINKQELPDVVINCVSHRNAEAAMALGRLIERYNGRINVVQYDPNKGIVSFSGDKNIGIGLNDKNFAVSEYIGLMGGKITNTYDVLYNNNEYDSLYDLFKMYSNTRYYKNDRGGITSFIPWNLMATFFAQNAKDDDSIDDKLRSPSNDSQDTSIRYQGSFLPNIFARCSIGKTLKKLQNYRIISGYSEKRTATSVTVTFDYYDTWLPEVLKPFEAESITLEHELFAVKHKQIKFIPMIGLKISNYFVYDKKLYAESESQDIVDTRISFLKELDSKGFIEDLRLGEEGMVSFAFKDEPTMSLLKKQGNVFELVVYHILRESGMFDDIETGTRIAWDHDEIFLDQVLLERLNSSDNMIYGYKQYAKVRSEVLYGTAKKSSENELDVIAIKGMSPVFISCKTGKGNKTEWLYEISSLSAHFMSLGVMAISNDMESQTKSMFSERAKQMGVSVLGTETLWNPDRLLSALKTIARHRSYYISE